MRHIVTTLQDNTGCLVPDNAVIFENQSMDPPGFPEVNV